MLSLKVYLKWYCVLVYFLLCKAFYYGRRDLYFDKDSTHLKVCYKDWKYRNHKFHVCYTLRSFKLVQI